MNKSPSATVKEQFGDKAKLVAALGPFTNDDLWVKRVNEKKGLERVSNAKLLKLFNVLSAVKDKFGTRFKLVDAICEVEKRAKDEGYKKRLLEYPVPRLYDLYRSAAKRAGVAVASTVPQARAVKAEAGEAKAKPSASKVAAAKAAPAKKPAAKPAAKPAPKKKA
jgi:hypothetical protein